jgi:hypothetical protein
MMGKGTRVGSGKKREGFRVGKEGRVGVKK